MGGIETAFKALTHLQGLSKAPHTRKPSSFKPWTSREGVFLGKHGSISTRGECRYRAEDSVGGDKMEAYLFDVIILI